MVVRFIKRHRIVVPIALVSVALVAAGGVLQAQGARHSHGIQMVYRTGSETLPRSGVNFVLLFCPSGTRITGIGSSTSGLAYVNEQDIHPSSNSGSVFYIDHFGSASTIRAQIACVTVIVEARHHARGRSSGIEVADDLFYEYRLQQGKIKRIRFHESWAQALEAAGLRE